MPVTVGKPGTKPVAVSKPTAQSIAQPVTYGTEASKGGVQTVMPGDTVVVGKTSIKSVGKAPETKKSELAALIAQIQKDKGDKIVFRGADVPDVARLPTGDFEFDFSVGGGFPRGRMAIIYGPESSCKTTMALRAAAVAQHGPAECNKAVFVDVEHSFDAARAEDLGVNVQELIVIKPGYGEEAADITVGMVGADDVAIVILDSLAAMISSAEIEKSAEKFDVGTAAIMIKRMCNKINLQLLAEAKRDHYPAVIFINQIRYKVGVVFGNPETTPGGKTPHFLSALTVRVTGKNKVVSAINADKPSFKELSFDVVKAKVGIIKSHFEFDMAMIAAGDLLAGETKSWGMVKDELQAAGLLKKGPKDKGWEVDGKSYSTLTQIEDTYYAEQEFALHLQQMVIATYAGKKSIVDNSKTFLAQSDDEVEPTADKVGGPMLFSGKTNGA